ncbi:hypothetical protein ACTFIR_001076 [Dictyostelium discoideum]
MNYKISTILIFLILYINKNYGHKKIEVFISPHEYIIKNEEGSNVPIVLSPICNISYYPILLMGKNLLKSNNNNNSIYIGKIPCTDVIQFKKDSSILEYYGDINNDLDSFDNYSLDKQYMNILLNYTNKHSDIEILKCNLQTKFISPPDLLEQDIYIAINNNNNNNNSNNNSNNNNNNNNSNEDMQSQNYILYKAVSKYQSNTDICNSHSQCLLTICLCDSFSLDGPLCNLKTDNSDNINNNNNNNDNDNINFSKRKFLKENNYKINKKQPLYNQKLPEIIYSNSNSSWTIRFTEIRIAGVDNRDIKSIYYNQFIQFFHHDWSIKKLYKLNENDNNYYEKDNQDENENDSINYSDSNINEEDNDNDDDDDDDDDQVYRYKLITSDISINIEVHTINNNNSNILLNDRFKYYKFGDILISITLSNVSTPLKTGYRFKMVFEVQTNIQQKSICGINSDLDPFEFEYGKNFNGDLKWLSTTSNFSTLYSRFNVDNFNNKNNNNNKQQQYYNEIDNGVSFDIIKDSYNQIKGNSEVFIYFEPFNDSITIYSDYKILGFIEFPNISHHPCKEVLPIADATVYLIPTIIPVISLALICLVSVVVNLVKTNNASLQFNRFGSNFKSIDDTDNNSNNNNNNNNSNNNSNNNNNNNSNNKYNNNNNNKLSSYNEPLFKTNFQDIDEYFNTSISNIHSIGCNGALTDEDFI